MGAIGILVVVGFIAVLVTEGLSETPKVARLYVQTKSVVSYDSTYAVEVVVENRGGQTGAGAVLSGTIMDGDHKLEEATTTLTYVPSESTREATLMFKNDPRRYKLELGITGYEEP